MSFELKYLKYLIIYELRKYIFIIMMVNEYKCQMSRLVKIIVIFQNTAKILNLN